MGVMGNLASSAMGMVTDGAGTKAAIYIPNPNIYVPGETTTEQEAEFNRMAKKLESQLFKEANNIMKEDPVAGAAQEKLGFKASAVNALKSVGSALAPGGANKVGEVYSGNENFFKITVQFNPSSIRMDSLNGPVQNLNNTGSDGVKMVNKQNFEGRTKMAFDLIFDDVDLMDAFMLQEVLDMNATKLVGKGLDMYSHAGNTFSVRARMEIFMGLISSGLTQHVIFAWGKMVFRGQVTGVTNHYTMFNTKGNPIRGTMHLEITQDSKKRQKYLYRNKAWKDSFDKTFAKDDTGGATGLMSKLTNNSILNI